MSQFNLTVFGGFDLRTAANAPVQVRSKKVRALLAYLALHRGRMHPRERIATLLWEYSADEQARSSLRQALTAIRRLPGGEALLRVTKDGLGMIGEAVSVDAGRFLDLIESTEPEDWRRAVALYTGELLTGLSLREDAFESWLQIEREKWRDLATAVHGRLLDHYLTEHSVADAEACANALLALDPLREDGHRALMRIYADQSRIAAALQQYQDCRVYLRRELGIDPDPETDRLYQQIVAQRQAAAAAPQSTPDPPPRSDPPPLEPSGASPAPLPSNACDACGQDNPLEATACGHCAAPMPWPCAHCGWKNAPESTTCTVCATARPGAIGKPTWTQALPVEGERRQLTVMVVDLERLERHGGPIDPEDLTDAALTFHDAVADIVDRFGGTVAQALGNRLIAYFGIPQAHEDDARRAVSAGLSLLDGVRPRDDAPPGLRLTGHGLRIGINTGPVIVRAGAALATGDGSSVIGETPTIAMQLPTLAATNSLVAGALTVQMIRQWFDHEPLGEHAINGVPDPIRVFRINRVSARPDAATATDGAVLTPLIGRELEVELLYDRWRMAADGEGQVVFVSGEPGIGKSRVAEALRERIADDDVFLLRLQGSPYYANTAFRPVVEQFAEAADIAADDPDGEKLAKLDATIRRAGMSVAAVAPVFAEALSIPTGDRYPQADLSPRKLRYEISESLARRTVQLARRKPVLGINEDAHWIDPSSLEAIGRAIELIHDEPVLLIVTARPEFEFPWIGHDHVTTLTLNRLSRRQTHRMIRRVAGNHNLPDEVVARIAGKTDGVPLFIEEVTKAVTAAGILQAGDETYELNDDSMALAIPATLQDSLMARLDRYPSARRLAQQIACIGRDCPYPILAAVSDLDTDDLHAATEQLIEAGVMLRRGPGPTADISFKHALLRDAAYGSMLRADRRAMHARIAEALVSRFAEQAAAEPETLAHHHASAGQAEQAMVQWLAAGRNAAARSANAEAVEHLTAGLKLKEAVADDATRDRLELELLIAFLGPKVATKGPTAPELEGIFERARFLSEKVQDRTSIYPVLYGQFVFHHVRGEFDIALEVAGRYLAAADDQDSALQRVNAHRLLGASHAVRGDLQTARGHQERVLTDYDPETQREITATFGIDAKVAALNYHCLTLWMLGYPDQAERRGEEARRHAERIGHDHSLAQALAFAGGTLYLARGQHQRTLKYANRLAELADERKFRGWQQIARCYVGSALIGLGRETDGLPVLRDALDRLPDSAAALYAVYNCALANGFLRLGRTVEAMAALDQLDMLPDGATEHWWSPEVLRTRAMVVQASDAEAAETYLDRAMAIAKRQGARTWQLRIALSLASLWAERGQRAAAHELLSPHYRVATEGFETADLVAAKTVLQDLEPSP